MAGNPGIPALFEARTFPQPQRPTLLSKACQWVRAENLVHLLINAWPVALGLAFNVDHGRGTLPFEALRFKQVVVNWIDTDVDPPPSTPELERLVDIATKRLMLALVELAWHDTVRADVANAVRLPLEQMARSHFLAADPASMSSTSSHCLARSIGRQGCPMEVCRLAVHLAFVQWLLLSDEAVRDALCGMYRLHEWEDQEEEEVGRHRLENSSADTTAAPVVGASEMQRDPLRPLLVVHDNLDCLFLRLRESPSLFASGTHS